MITPQAVTAPLWLIPPLTLQQAAERAWQIRRLFAARAVDYAAAGVALESLAARSDNPRVEALCRRVADDLWRMVHERQAAAAAATSSEAAS